MDSRKSLISSIPLLLAASISITSISVPAVIALQCSHSMHGWLFSPLSQFRALARMRATVVLPVPLGPANKYAWDVLPVSTDPFRMRTTVSWPMTLSNVVGRYLRYSETYRSVESMVSVVYCPHTSLQANVRVSRLETGEAQPILSG